MKYVIKRNENIVASVRPEGQLQTSVMGEELVTMTFSLSKYVHFQTGDTVEVYGNIYYLASEPQVEKISSREFRYSLEFQGVKYELAKVQYLFPDAQNVLNLSDFHIMGTARQMLDLLVQNANRIGQGWSLGSIDQTETKQLNFSAENCLAVLAKIAQEFKLEYWVDGDKSIHLTERKAISGYTFEYGKAKGLKSLTRQTYEGSNIVTRLYAFGSEKNIAGNYRGGQQKLRMNVPYLEKNTNIYGVIESSQTFDVYPHRLGTVTAVNPSNPLQFTDSGMDFDLNARENGNTKYLINGVSVKVTFNTGQLAGYTFEVKEFGYNTATKTFTLLKNQDEKAIEVPSENLRPAIGDKYVLTDLIMPESYITNAEAELQQKAQEYLNENSRQRLQYTLTTDAMYFREQNVNIALGTTVRAIDKDFNLDDNLRVIRLIKDLQNPYKVQFDVAERAEIAYIVREYLEAEKAKIAMVQADKFNAEMARRAYRFGREISENVFDGEGYFNAEKIKPLSIETKLLSVGSRMQQFALPDVLITVPNATTVTNTQGKIVHLSLEEQPREWNIAANTQGNVSPEFNYVYIRAQRNGTNASVLVSPEKIGVESDADFYHFEAGYLGSLENGQRRLRMSHGFTQINPFEITTGRIAPPSGNHHIELLHDRINIVGNLHISNENMQEIKTAINPDLLLLENRLKSYTDNTQIGGRNLLRHSIVNETSTAYGFAERTINLQAGETYTLSINGRCNNVPEGVQLMVYLNLGDWSWSVHTGTASTEDKTFCVTFVAPKSDIYWIYSYYYPGSEPKLGNVTVNWYKVEKGNKPTDWTPAPEDTQNQINEAERTLKAYADSQDLLQKTLIQAHTDGKISEAEQRQISNAEAKLQEAKNHANNAVNNLKIGGRNLILNSHIEQPFYVDCELSEPLIEGETYTFSWESIGSLVGKIFINNSVIKWFDVKGDGSVWTRYAVTFVFTRNDYHNKLIFPHIYGATTVRKYKLERGDKATDSTPAPEDVQNKIANVKSDLETALANARAMLDAEDRNIKEITRKLSEKTDFINETKINGNTVATGALLVGNTLGGNAGINGSGVSSNDVRFFAGSNFSNRGNAPFRVLDNGKLFATNAEIEGVIKSTKGKIGNFKISGSTLESSTKRGFLESDLSADSWEAGTEYASISPSQVIYRQNGNVRGKYYKDVIFGYTNPLGVNGAMMKVCNKMTDEPFLRKDNVAIEIQTEHAAGHNIAIVGIGNAVFFEYGYRGGSYVNIIKDNFTKTHLFIFTTRRSEEVHLPNVSDIQNALGSNDITFELTIICSDTFGSLGLLIKGTQGGNILDSRGGIAGGNYGAINLVKGNILQLRYYGGDYYIISHRN